MKNYKKQKNNGFTLLETLIALTIFTTAVVALLGVLASNISSITYAKKKVIASTLAQEGIEYVRNVRDTYDEFSVSDGWVDFTTALNNAFCNSNSGCYFDNSFINYSNHAQEITLMPFYRCNLATPYLCKELSYITSNGKYNYDSNNVNALPSGYYRRIQIYTDPSYPAEAKIYSTVFWDQGSGSYSVTLSETMFNWIQ